MKVGIDGRLLFRNVTGIERHMWNLCSGLNAQNHEGCSYLLYTTNAFEFAGDLQPGFREEVITSGPDLLRRRLQELENIAIKQIKDEESNSKVSFIFHDRFIYVN